MEVDIEILLKAAGPGSTIPEDEEPVLVQLVLLLVVVPAAARVLLLDSTSILLDALAAFSRRSSYVEATVCL